MKMKQSVNLPIAQLVLVPVNLHVKVMVRQKDNMITHVIAQIILNVPLLSVMKTNVHLLVF